MIAVGILGIAVMITMQMFSNNMQSLKLTQRKGEQEDLRHYVRTFSNCKKTFDSQPCSGTIAVLNPQSKKVIKKSGSTVGDYTLTAKCTEKSSGTRKISVKATHSGTGNTTQLFDAVPFLCPANNN